MKNSFGEAVDSGRRSGCGKFAYSLYQECIETRAGSPSAE